MTDPTRDCDCSRFGRWLTPHVDGELDAVHTIEVEEHLEICEHCREQVELFRAMRTSLRESATTRAPSSLRDRVLATLAAERHAEADLDGQSDPDGLPAAADSLPEAEPSDAAVVPLPARQPRPARPQLVKLRYVFPLAAAAAAVLVIGAVQYRQSPVDPAGIARTAKAIFSGPHAVSTGKARNPGASPVLASIQPLDQLVEDLVAQHAEQLPPVSTDPKSLQRFDRFVGVRVPKPEFKSFGGKYLGARVHPVRGNKSAARTAMLQYMVRNRHRVTVYVFDSRRVPMKDSRMEHRKVGKQKIYVGHLRGYSVAASERNGVGYALASDLSGAENAEMVMVAAR